MEGRGGVALKVFPSTSTSTLICKKGRDRGLFKFLNLSLLCRVEYLGDGHP